MLNMNKFTSNFREAALPGHSASRSTAAFLLGLLFILLLSPITLWAAVAPTGQADRAVITATTTTSVTLSVSGGTSGGNNASVGSLNRLVVLRASTDAAVAPTDGVIYTASLSPLTSPASTTGTGNFVIKADNNTNSFTVTGLTPNTTYYCGSVRL
jgi:hypothetical protein